MRRTLVGLLAAFAASCAAATPEDPGEPIAASKPTEYYVVPVAERRVGALPEGPLYWRIETFPSATAAKSAEGPHALSASVAGRHWLFTLGRSGGDSGGVRVAEIGPVAVLTAETYLLRINHAGGPPGAQTPVHSHPGSEAIYVLRGEISQRSPLGVMRAKAGETLNAHSPEMIMQIASSGTGDLEQLVMFVVDADRPFSPPARFED